MAAHDDKLSDARTAVVFGGAGFIGTHLARKLRSIGYDRIVCIDKCAPKTPVSGVEYTIADVRDLSDVTLDLEAPLIFNLAAVHTTPGHEPWEYYDANVLGAVEVTQFAIRHNAHQIVFTSSISVYGPDEAAKEESSPPKPVSDYGRSKFQAERIHRAWLEQNDDNKLVIVRPAVVFGNGEGGNFTRLAQMLERGVFIYPGRRDTIKSCIYVGDLVTWMLAAAAKQDRFILFNGAYSNRYTIEEIVETFRRTSFPDIRTWTVPAYILRSIAAMMRPFSATGLGIHPDRITKLMVSTNILPRWAEAEGLPTHDRLETALSEWKQQGNGRFV